MQTARRAKVAKSIPKAQGAVGENKKAENEIRTVRTAQCQSLSGNSTLGYAMGLDGAGELHLRVLTNTKAGAFCQDWIDLRAVLAALEKAPKGETVTSEQLAALYRRRGANMPGFVFSVLLHEGLVRRSSTEKRRYEQVGPQERDAILKALAEGNGAVDSKARKVKGTKAITDEKPFAPTKKKKALS
jgi:hypothetical protein